MEQPSLERAGGQKKTFWGKRQREKQVWLTKVPVKHSTSADSSWTLETVFSSDKKIFVAHCKSSVVLDDGRSCVCLMH